MYNKIKININTIEKVKCFAESIIRFEEDIDVISGRFVLDGKSIMGLLSLDLSKNIEVMIHTKDDSVYNEFLEIMEQFRVDE